jgi:phospholipase C
VRVPTVLVSPHIPAGTVWRAPAGGVPFDHTSILATIEQRWHIPPLTARDAAAPPIGNVASLAAARTDDPLAGVVAPAPTPLPAALAEQPAHLQEVAAQLMAARRGRPSTAGALASLRTNEDYHAFIDAHSP